MIRTHKPWITETHTLHLRLPRLLATNRSPGYIFNMNRPAGRTTEVTRALWFRISPRRMFLVCRQVFQCFTLVCILCMSAWINERMTEWLFFFRLKTKNLIKTKKSALRWFELTNLGLLSRTLCSLDYRGCCFWNRACWLYIFNMNRPAGRLISNFPDRRPRILYKCRISCIMKYHIVHKRSFCPPNQKYSCMC